MGLLGRVHKQTPLVAVSTCLKSQNISQNVEAHMMVIDKVTPRLMATGNWLSLTYHNLSPGTLTLDCHPHPLILFVLNVYVLFQN